LTFFAEKDFALLHFFSFWDTMTHLDVKGTIYGWKKHGYD
jgi:hypothetical protein